MEPSADKEATTTDLQRSGKIKYQLVWTYDVQWLIEIFVTYIFIGMNNWKKLTLKKRRIEEDEQHRKVGDWKKTELFETNIGTEKQSSVGTKKTNNYPESIKRSTILGPSADHRAKNTSDEIEGQGGR